MTKLLRATSFWSFLLVAPLWLLAWAGARAQAPAWQMAISAGASAISTSSVTGTATDASGNVYLVGRISGTVSFGSTTLSSFGYNDAYVAKWSPATGSFVWARNAGGSANDEALGVAVSGTSVYVVGDFASQSISFGSTALPLLGRQSIFVAKFTDAGSFVWAQRAGGAANDKATAVAVSGNNIYLTGTFDSRTSAFGATTLTNASNSSSGTVFTDVFVAKLIDAGPSAAFAWSYRAGSTEPDEAVAVAVSGTSVYVTGGVLGFSAAFGPLTIPVDGSDNIFVAKLTDAGSSAGFTWVKKVEASLATSTALAVNGTNVYLAGYYLDASARFDDQVLGYDANPDNCFITKIADAGSSATFVWALPAYGIYNGEIRGLAVSGTAVYVSGGFTRTGTFGTINLSGSNLSTNAPDVFLAKITDAGPTAGFVWAQAGGGPDIDVATSMVISGTNLYCGGGSVPPATYSGHLLTGPFSSNGVAMLVGTSDPTLAAPAPTLTGFSPASGVNGDLLTLTGTNLTGTSLICFGGRGRNLVTSGFTVNAAGTQITGVAVPAGAVSGPISVTTAGGTSTSSTPFTVNTAQLLVAQNGLVYPPQSRVYDFGSQVLNTASATVVFTLSNPGATTLLVSGASTTGDFSLVGTPTASVAPGSTGTVAVAFRPTAAGARFGTLVVSSSAAGFPAYTVNLTGTGTLPVPAGLSFSPASGLVGAVVSLTGTGLANASRLTFSGVVNNVVTGGFVVNAAGTQITNIVVPAGAVTGPVTVTTPGGVSAGIPFTVPVPQLPVIASINPGNGPAGTAVTVAGTDLSGALSLNFSGGFSAACTVVNSTTVRAVVPVGAVSGPVTLTTPVGTSNGVAFGVPPVISSLSPFSGSVGQVVSVQAATGTSAVTAVTLNGLSLPFTVSSSGALSFTVPAGASTGFVTITTADGTSNGVAFSVVSTVFLTSVAPASGLPGSTISLNGSNLAGVTAVVFSGTGLNTVTSGFVINAAGTQITGIVVPSGAQTGPVTVLTTRGAVIANGISFAVGAAPLPYAPGWQTAASISPSSYGGASGVTATATDASGNIFVAGYFAGTLRLGATTLVSTGVSNAFIAKWNPGGNRFEWAVAAGGAGTSSYTYINGLVVQGSTVYAAGAISGTTTVFGNLTLTNAGPPLTQDVFVAKLTDTGTTGTFVWAQRAGGLNSDIVASMAVEGANIYLAGSFGYSVYSAAASTATFGNVVLTNPGSGTADAFVAKLTDAGASGTFAWALRAGGIQNDAASGVAVSNGNVYLAGRFEGQVASFGGLTLASRGLADGFIGKVVDAGSTAGFAWVQPVSGHATDGVQAVAVAGANVYVTGVFSGPVAFGSALLTFETAYITTDIFVAKLTDNGGTGTFAWAIPAASAGDDEVFALALSGTSIYITGRFSDRTRFGNQSLTSAGNQDAFIAKVTDAGNTGAFAWAQQGGGPGADQGQTLATTSSSVYMAGYVNPPASFGSLTIPNPAVTAGAFMGFLASVSLGPLATKAPLATRPGLELFPNPARGTVRVRLPNVAGPTRALLSLTDALGRTVRTQDVVLGRDGQTADLNIQGVASGAYVVQLKTNTLTAACQLMVE
ncbi:choice-of-anchor D domain-containing protein [Hymenobacter sp. M29]|uniref:Choice-of-anchor D domain-containing protein n=1 Tax=Hymenobacter mellowenesis TaxID=3063995 RepID=A0ABT9A7Q7_9BACT|nr:choice-of-anchor D domain-containing protein [Hymenobacter sp. M29]MDO7845880.1 choice-of-anchor D domain-containing protein [Hymenobacter sp. M29]